MVTGRRAFAGEDISETIASILRSEPDWSGVPASIKPLLVSCLQKDPRHRLRDIGDVAPAARSRAGRGDTDRAGIDADGGEGARGGGDRRAAGQRRDAVARARGRDPSDTAPVVRSTLHFPRGSSMQLGANQPSLAVSPDGKTIVYTALGPEGSMLWTYSVDAFDPKPLAGTGGGRAAMHRATCSSRQTGARSRSSPTTS